MPQRTPILSFSKAYAERVKDRLTARSYITADGCIEWTGSVDRYGYGNFKITEGGNQRNSGSHRAAWIAYRGPIPSPELEIDHLCRNRRCFNVEHLELVTTQENTRRGVRPAGSGRPRLIPGKHSCGKHRRDDGYDVVRNDGYTAWVCRICRRKASAAYRARLRALKD